MPALNSISGDDNPNVLNGTSADDAIFGLGGNDTLVGLEGNDWINGGTGIDVMTGGIGDDTFVVDATGDTTVELAGEGTDTVRASLSWVLAAHVENLVLTGSLAISGTGNALDNMLTGNDAANILNGGAGNDWLDGNAGADTMIGGAGNDTFVVDSAGDVVREAADEGRDVVRAAIGYVLADHLEDLMLTGHDAIDGVGNGVANVLTGNDAGNILTGLDGNDTLDGGAGADVLIGGTGNDTYVIDDAGDQIVENAGEGIDAVRAGFSYVLGDTVENLVLTGSDAVDGTGNAADNVLTGNAAANILIGLGGNDTLAGQGGGDTLVGGLGNDTYVLHGADDIVIEAVGEGTDTVQADFSVTLGAEVENLVLTGSSAIDGTGNALDNVLTGNSAANVLTGGAGNDVYIVDNAGDFAVEDAGGGTDTVAASISWTLGNELESLVLTGTAAISGTGNAIDNTIDGNGAANLIDGSGGADTMAGHKGNDTYVVDSAADVVIEARGEGKDTVLASVTYALAANVEGLVLTGQAAIDARGNALANTIVGNDAANVIDGGGATDHLDGAGGSDLYLVSGIKDHSGNEITDSGTTGTDEVRIAATVAGTYAVGFRETGVERIVIGSGVEAVADGSGVAAININAARSTSALTLIGNAGDNRITGTAFDDEIDGGAGIDAMIGGAGNDRFHVDNSADRVSESAKGGTDTVIATATFRLGGNIENLVLAGTDAIGGTGNVLANTIDGNEAANLIDAGKGNDTLRGHGGADTLIGNAGDDVIEGGNGNDVLMGGLGDDTLTGGADADVFRFNTAPRVAAGFDVVTDFARAEGDRIELGQAQMKALGTVVGVLGAEQFYGGAGVTQAHDASDRIIYNAATGDLWYDADGIGIRFEQVRIAQFGIGTHPDLAASDFLIV